MLQRQWLQLLSLSANVSALNSEPSRRALWCLYPELQAHVDQRQLARLDYATLMQWAAKGQVADAYDLVAQQEARGGAGSVTLRRPSLALATHP